MRFRSPVLLLGGKTLTHPTPLYRTQRLSGEREKASHALREWGNAEGPDLGVRRAASSLVAPRGWLAGCGARLTGVFFCRM